jgi:hypothetical protein
MSPVKALLAGVLAAGSLSACATVSRPDSGRGRSDDPRDQAGRLQCLLAHHLPAVKSGTIEIQIGPPPAGPRITFLPTAGSAQAAQIEDQEQGAEVIGSALLYPNQAPDRELKAIEDCLARGVSG